MFGWRVWKKFQVKRIGYLSNNKILNKLSDSYNIVYCFSRRTPENIKNYIINNKVEENDFYPKASFNPYETLLNESSTFFVTEDSVGMISDAYQLVSQLTLLELKKLKRSLKILVL